MDNELHLDFDKLMVFPLICLKCLNVHPDIPQNLSWFLRFSVMFSIYTVNLYLLTYGLLAMEDIKNNIIDTCSIASYIVIYFVISFKAFILVKYQANFKKSIGDVKTFYEVAKTLPEDEQKVVLKYALEGRKVSKYWVVIISMGILEFFARPIMIMLYYLLSGNFKLVSVVDMKYPGFLTVFNADAIFWITFLFWECYALYTGIMYIAMVPLGPIFMLHACGQLELLKGRMMKMFPADGSVTPEERAVKLRDIAVELQAIYDFVDNLKIALKLLYELTLKGTALLTPITMYVMIEGFAQSQIRLEFAVLIVGALIICSLPCYYGDKLIEKSCELQEAVYFSGWECFYDRKTRSTLLILMTRMQRTVAIRSIFVTVCLEALTDVFNQAYALFSFLHTAWG